MPLCAASPSLPLLPLLSTAAFLAAFVTSSGQTALNVHNGRGARCLCKPIALLRLLRRLWSTSAEQLNRLDFGFDFQLTLMGVLVSAAHLATYLRQPATKKRKQIFRLTSPGQCCLMALSALQTHQCITQRVQCLTDVRCTF